ncbi:MAG: hypothetical protein LBC27_08245 [Spirochaetaceae bacterium]|jgi:hypothetical protein|nr:hypothetical protein [Spirochaetaceae bacterium]
MRKIMWFGAAVLAALAFISCSEDGGVIGMPGGDDGTTGNYTITVSETVNGRISASRSKASPPQVVTINAYPADASEWAAGEGVAPENISPVDGGGGG